MLNIEHLTKTYGGKAAVQDLSLHIRPGEICAFIGHNGAGKTTTLKCCCGIQQFDGGRITVDGISVQDDPLECKRRLAYLPDNPDLYDYMTGIKYLNFIADVFGVTVDYLLCREDKRFLDISALSDEEAAVIYSMVELLKNKRAKAQ